MSAARRTLLEMARDSGAVRWAAGKVLALDAVHALAARLYGGLGSIVVLHRVVPAAADITTLPGFGGEIDAAFLRQILHFCRERRIALASLDEVADRLASNAGARERFVAFTFDDGWRDNLTLALPIFRELEAPFAVYVATSFPDCGPLAWKYNLRDALPSRSELRLPDGAVLDLSTPEGRDDAYRAFVARFVAAREAGERARLLASIADSDALARKAGELALGWEEVRALANDPLVTIGAHTEHHYNLALLPEEALREELAGSKRKLESATGRRVDHFAYPYGGRAHAGPREFAAARDAGFRTAVTTRVGNVFPEHAARMHCLPRIPASGKLNRIEFFRASQSGLVPALANGLRRVVTE